MAYTLCSWNSPGRQHGRYGLRKLDVPIGSNVCYPTLHLTKTTRMNIVRYRFVHSQEALKRVRPVNRRVIIPAASSCNVGMKSLHGKRYRTDGPCLNYSGLQQHSGQRHSILSFNIPFNIIIPVITGARNGVFASCLALLTSPPSQMPAAWLGLMFAPFSAPKLGRRRVYHLINGMRARLRAGQELSAINPQTRGANIILF